MKYNKIENIIAEEFRRLTGVKIITFEKMVEILRDAEIHKKARGGKPNKLLMEDHFTYELRIS